MSVAMDSSHPPGGGRRRWCLTVTILAAGLLHAALALAQPQPPADPAGAGPDRLRDRGDGLPTSLFGTYVRKGELLVYPFYEHYRDHDFEYAPVEFGAIGEEDYRGRYRAHEALIFVAYGLGENVAFEIEAAVIQASLTKSPADPSDLPQQLRESGLGDIEGQIRWRWNRESDRRPEVFSYAELVVPHHRDKLLIGTPGVELKFGTGVIRGFRWGTLTSRVAIDYEEASSSHFDLGEYAVEYLRRLSPAWRVYAGIEGSSDELSLIGEIQWHVSPNVFIRLNNGVGLTSKATDWAPEIGILFSFGPR